MKVFGTATDDALDWTAPYPARPECRMLFGRIPVGIKARMLGGDMLSPDVNSGRIRPGREAEGRNFFTVIPGTVTRAVYEKADRPFFSVRVGRFGFYMGHKVFGVDQPAYLDYPLVAPSDVFTGSRALSAFTARFTSKLTY